MRAAALLLLLSVTPAFAASFDGVWQGTSETGKPFRYAIHGDEVHFYVERDGQFVEDGSCSISIVRKGKDAFVAYQECAAGGGPLAMSDGYRLSAKNANGLRVRYESQSGRHEDRGDWMRVR
jgi:hypothetical protein